MDALARVVHRDKAQRAGRIMVAKMKELMTRQQVDIAIQAAANNKIIARETIKVGAGFTPAAAAPLRAAVQGL